MAEPFPLIGRSRELERMADALRKRQSLLIVGAAGSGKTTLIRAAIDRSGIASETIHLEFSQNLHCLLVELARRLLHMGHNPFCRLAGLKEAEAEQWLSHQASVHLKGLLWGALETEPRIIILDGIERAGFPMYRFLQRLYFVPGMAVFAVSKDLRSLGALRRLFWDPRDEIRLHPLHRVEAERLFYLAVEQFGLGHLNVVEFKRKVLESAHGNPGQIIEMCRLASTPLYVSGTHIQFVSVRMDALMRFLN